MFRPYEVDANHFEYACGLEKLKSDLIDANLSVFADAGAVYVFIKDRDLNDYKIYYYLSLQGMSDVDIKIRLAKDISECEVW
jgi:hypothetical protein